MQKSSVFLAFSITVLVGCSSTHNVQRNAAAEWVPEASKHLLGIEVTVTDRTGVEHEGEVVGLDERQIQLSREEVGDLVSIQLDSAWSIRSGSNAGSIFYGTLAGMFFGGGITRVILSARELGNSSGGYSLATALGSVIGAFVGGVLGGVITGIATWTHDYVIMDSSTVRSRPVTGE